MFPFVGQMYKGQKGLYQMSFTAVHFALHLFMNMNKLLLHWRIKKVYKNWNRVHLSKNYFGIVNNYASGWLQKKKNFFNGTTVNNL